MRIQLEAVKHRPTSNHEYLLELPELTLEPGSRWCVRGASGSGKSTLLQILAGLTAPTSGRILYGDTVLGELSEAARDRFRAAHIGYVFQTAALLPQLSALENVALAMTIAGHPTSAARERGQELLKQLELTARAGARPGQLSVGERQRVALARAIACRPAVVLADEPTSALDRARSLQVQRLLFELVQEVGATLVCATHDQALAESGFDHTLDLDAHESDAP